MSAPTPSSPPAPDAQQPVVAVRGLEVQLGTTTILHDIDLTVMPGELVALLGANGSGKSTLLRTIVGILPARRGEIRLWGRRVQDRRIHDRIGYVPQHDAEAGSIPATARETIATGLLGARRWFTRSRDVRIATLLADVGLTDLADRPVTQMSGGQRQRVMIARALVRRPELLVLDEPFSGVDLETQTSLAQLIGRLSERGTTVVVVLHELGPLAEAISRAVVLDHGRIVHDGDPAARPLLDPGHDHAVVAEECLGQELHP